MTKDRIIQVLKNLKFTTTHYQVPVEVISDAQFDAAAEQILLLIQQPNNDSQPQLKQTSVSGSPCSYCNGKGKIFHWEFGQFVKCGFCQGH